MSPENASAHTLISPEHGWRLARRRRPDGSFALDWYCKDCWRLRKDLRPDSPNEGSEAGKTFMSALAALKKGSGKP
jgi:hypothetical protein